MLVKGNEFNRHANMMSAPAAAALTELESGQGIMLNADGEVILCDGTARGFLAMSDMNDTKDNVTNHGGQVSYVIGSAIVTVDNGSYDDGETYAYGTRLTYVAGILTPFDEATPGDDIAISAMALGPAVDNTLRVVQI